MQSTFPNTTSWHLYRIPIRSGSKRKPSFFVYSLFFVMDNARSYCFCPDALTFNATKGTQLTVVNPDITSSEPSSLSLLSSKTPFPLSNRSGSLCRVSLFLFLFCFFIHRNHCDTDLPGWPLTRDHRRWHREPHLEHELAVNSRPRYLQQTRVSRIFQHETPLQYGPAPWKPSFSVYYFVSSIPSFYCLTMRMRGKLE